MQPLEGAAPQGTIAVDWDENLETVIGMVNGDTSNHFVMEKEGQPQGIFDMHDIMVALVPQGEIPLPAAASAVQR